MFLTEQNDEQNLFFMLDEAMQDWRIVSFVCVWWEWLRDILLDKKAILSPISNPIKKFHPLFSLSKFAIIFTAGYPTFSEGLLRTVANGQASGSLIPNYILSIMILKIYLYTSHIQCEIFQLYKVLYVFTK